MKKERKNDTKKKLKLTVEKLRELTEQEANLPSGGGGPGTVPSACCSGRLTY